MNVSDLDRVLEINAANVPDVGAADPAHIRHLFDESSIALVCEITDEQRSSVGNSVGNGAGIAGFCILFAPGADYDSINYQWFAEHHPGSMYLDRVAFDDRFQGQGLGTQMYTEVERLIGEQHPDVSLFTLEVNIDPPNEPSLAFHRKLGFTEVGRHMSHGIEVSLMSRQL